ncbi:di-heme oxidoreductase family protein [Derxia lacustris]|uniref:di-heme oxidoreductase family protein n=1 Tax=Derxia lacustris TaxID=764842 RepID=UPI001F46520A|nr:di-heme oxidoredictase family protein [Derxia lacustris]
MLERAAGPWLAAGLMLLALLLAPPVSAEPTAADAERLARPPLGLDDDGRAAFLRGRALFRQNWVIAPSDDRASGLGPLYNRISCVACHAGNGRGRPPERPDQRLRAMLVRLSLPGSGEHGAPRPHPRYGDQLNEEGVPGVAPEGRAAIDWLAQPHRLADGSTVELRRPRIRLTEPGYGPFGAVLTSARIGSPVLGLGLLDAVPAADLQRLASQPRDDGVRGRVNVVWSVAQGRTVIGRFGWKANAPDLRQQIAAAMIGDLGISSHEFPAQNCMPAQTACRAAPTAGAPELTDTELDDLARYLALLGAPPRRDQDAPEVRRGELRFAAAGCAACHRATLPVDAAAFALRLGIAAPAAPATIAPYTDLLLHDLGAGLADGRPDYRAGPRDWRTPPLWGIGLADVIDAPARYLHDGRARSLEEAILWHDGEARAARLRYERLGAAGRAELLAFLRSL